jgi:hypothetical protein
MRILLLSEDASKDARPTLEALVKKMLRLVDEQCRTNALRFEPPEEATAVITRANLWKSAKPADHQKTVALCRMLATKLAEQPAGFVLFHIDGDRRWSERAKSENCAKFDRLIRARVRDVLVHEKPDWTAAELDRCMARLVLLVPFYSIEAWTYQNTQRARTLCREHHGGRDVDRFEAWERDRAALDEVEQPKHATCLADRHNRDLAENAFPHREACAAGTSLAAAVEALSACTDLRDALHATHAP